MKAIAIAAAMVCAAACAGARQSQPDTSNPIHVTGCVEKGAEAGCLLLKETETGQLFQLLVRGRRPQPGEGIDITGVPFRGVTSCMQGQPVSVNSWSRSEMQQCTEEEPPPR